jgi:hypothetical protein
MVVAIVVVMACGGGDDAAERDDAATGGESDARQADAADGTDAASSTDAASESDGGVSGLCNPVTQQGCAGGEKCSWLVVQEDPFLGRTDCVPDGTVAIGDACVEGPPGETTGYDDCEAGGLCMSDVCRTICNIDPDSCGDGFACSTYSNTFTDDVTENLGVCDPTCDPVAQTCADPSQGCYLQLFNGVATCSDVAAGAEDLTQGDQCANDGARCFLNGCARGYGGFLFTGNGVPRDCTAFCTPVDTYRVDPDGDGAGLLVAGADANGAAPYDCSEARIGVLNHQCRYFQSFFVDMNSAYLDYIDSAYGFCVPRNPDYGSCTRYSEEWFLEEYNDYIEGGGTPDGWGDQLAILCDGNPGCTWGCARVETLDALDTAYCDVPANSTRPACVDGLVGARIVRRSVERIAEERWLRAAITGSR